MRGSAAFRAAVAPGGVLAGPWVRNELWRRARAVPSLDLRVAENKNLVDAVTGQSLITFTRASSGTYVDSAGVIRTATTDEARFDHNPTTGESLGLLVEEQQTNLLLQSEDFSTTWTNSGSSENVNVAVAPGGTLTADALVDTAVSETHNFTQSVVGLSGSTSYTFSCYMKKGSKDFGALIFSPNASWGTGSGASAFFNLSTGTVNTTSSATASIQALPNGWYRCIATATTVASPGTVTLRIAASLNGTSQTYTGSGDEAIYVWGADLKAGALVTSYIPTTTSTVTRSADVADIISAAIANNIRSLYLEFRSPASGTRGVVSLNDSTANERIEILTSGTDPRLVVVDGGSEQANINGGSVVANQRTRIAARINANGFAISINGGAAVADTSGTLPTVDRLMLGRTQAGDYLNGHLARVIGWQQLLPDSTLQELSR